jgi:flagellar hook-associated protein 2
LGKADESGVLVGSFAKTIEVSATDTLDSLIEKINQARLNVTASLVNDGTGDTPYRMVLTSRTAGSQGLVTFSTDMPALTLDTLSKPRDAVVVVGDPASPNAVVVNSSSNTIKDLLPGLTLNLVGTSNRPVQVTVGRDVESIVSAVKSFIDSFNSAMDQIDQLTRFVPDTQEKGVLFGEATVRQVQSRLFQIINQPVSKTDLKYRTLGDLGIMVDSSSGSARLTLQRTLKGGQNTGDVTVDGEQMLRDAIMEDPDSVKKLFSLVETDANGKLSYVGAAAKLNHELTEMTITGGLLPGENDRLQSKVDQFNDQATKMQALLDMKEQRLYAQFQAMEMVLAGLQTQQSALESLTQLAYSMSSSSG